MSFEIRKKPQAERDIEECFVFIGEENLDVAVHFLVAVEDSIELLRKNPFLGNIRAFQNSRISNIRMTLVKGFHNYQIYYTVGEESIEIVRVLHGSRDLSDIFG